MGRCSAGAPVGCRNFLRNHGKGRPKRRPMRNIAESLTDRMETRKLELVAGESAIWEPVESDELTSDSIRAQQAVTTELPASFVERVIDVIRAPRQPGESHAMTFERRERELRHLFAGLTPLEAMACRKRLTVRSPDDAFAAAFARLSDDRRSRLHEVLAGAPRRALLKAVTSSTSSRG